MEFCIGLLFPQTPEEILEVSADYQEWQYVLEDLMFVKKLLIEQDIRFSFCYDAEIVKHFADTCQELIGGGVYWKNFNIMLRQIIGRNSQDVSRHHHICADHCYQWWNIMSYTTHDVPNILKEMTEGELVGQKHYVALSLLHEDTISRDLIPIIKDARHVDGLPKLVNLPYFHPVLSCVEWFNHSTNKSDFSLSHSSKFVRTVFIYKPSRQRIYQERETGNYWYYDSFHKDNRRHYEVFDAQTFCHICEADMSGNPLPDSQDTKKSIRKYVK